MNLLWDKFDPDMKSTQPFRFSAVASSVPIQLLVCFFVIYAVTAPGAFEVIDGEMRYQTAQSWLHGNGGAMLPGKERFGVPGRDGHSYSWYGPFQSVLMTPILAIVTRLSRGNSEQLFKLAFGVVVIPFVSALSLAILFRALRTLRFGEREAFLAVLLIGLATPMWHYGRSGQEENIIGLAFGLYLWGLGQLFAEHFGGLRLIALGASVIFATRWSYLPALAMLSIPVIWLLWRRRSDWRRWWKSLAVSAAFASAVIASVLWYNTYRFGRPFESGYGVYFRLHPRFFTFNEAPNHFFALMLSPYRGLLWFCPTLLLLFGLKSAPKGSSDACLRKTVFGAWIVTWAFIATFSFWNGGPAWAPRYLVALLVLLAPAFASVFASGQRWRAVVAISILIQFCSTLLPSSSEDFVYVGLNREHPGVCTPWVCGCSALCLRGPWSLRALQNTILARALPVVELPPSAKASGERAISKNFDFNSVYWWPVRAAYQTKRLDPALVFAMCMLILSAAFGALRFLYARLPRSPGSAAVVTTANI